MGRPSSFEDKFCELLVGHMSKGYSYESFAGDIGVAKQTLYTWEKKHKKFLDAKKRGSAACQIWWERIGMAALLGRQVKDGDKFLDGKKFNVTMWIFNMKNRFNWSDRQTINTEDEEGTKQPVNGFVFIKPEE